MLNNKKLVVKNIEIIIFQKGEANFISLTNIARYKDKNRSDYILQNWMRAKSTIEFLGLWELLNNDNFNSIEFDGIKNEAGTNSFVLTPKRWVADTNAIGIISKTGRYGGTFAHQDIAFEFASWISPEFKLYLIKDFQRLKSEESDRLKLGWDVRRELTKINYRIHTDAVKKYLVPSKLSTKQISITYANEADVLNVALFNQSAAQWRKNNPSKQGNLRDYSTVEQLVVLANLESFNAEFIRKGIGQSERLLQLNQIAIVQMGALMSGNSTKRLVDGV